MHCRTKLACQRGALQLLGLRRGNTQPCLPGGKGKGRQARKVFVAAVNRVFYYENKWGNGLLGPPIIALVDYQGVELAREGFVTNGAILSSFHCINPLADSGYKLQCLFLCCLSFVPFDGTWKCVDWILLVKELIAKIEKLRNFFLLLKVWTIFWVFDKPAYWA